MKMTAMKMGAIGFLTKGFPSVRSKWFFEHKKWVKVLPRDAYTYLEYHFFDKNGNKIK